MRYVQTLILMVDCIVFDLDGTLAKSKQSIDSEITSALTTLLDKTCVAVASGGKFEQLKIQVADQLHYRVDITHLYLLPTSGATLYAFIKDKWVCIYEETLTQEEADEITYAIHEANDKVHIVDFSEPSIGDRIEFRGAQVSFSALGQEAPLEEKNLWDKSRTKRNALRSALIPLLSAYEVRIGGTTTIDITKKGIDKAYGVQRLSEYLKIPLSNMIYVGDELVHGGNDEAVLKTSIRTHSVTNPDDTKHFIESLSIH